MIQEVCPLADVEIKHADGIDFFHLIVFLTQRNMFRNGLGYTIKYPFQIIKLTGVLDFDDDNLILAVLGLDVYPVELVVGGQLVTLAFQNFDNLDLLADEYGKESFENTEIRFLSQ